MSPGREVLPLPSPEALEAASGLASRAPEPARVGRVLLGTAGWTDRSLVQSGLFYPPGTTSAEARLKHYARHFAMVEVDATYYALLPPEVVSRWIAWTPETFRFDVKAHPILTGHPIDTRRLPADLAGALEASGVDAPRVYANRMPPSIAIEIERRFRDLVEPLARAGRLGCVMLQFPPWFKATRGNMRHIESVSDRWAGVPLSVEFRDRSWLLPQRRERVLDVLRARGLTYVAVDEPDVPGGGVPPVVAVTRPKLSIVRFHGHNAAGWRRGATVAERFNYLYAPGELEAWVEPVRRLAREAEEVHVVFNNCVRNYAVLGAKGLAVLLES